MNNETPSSEKHLVASSLTLIDNAGRPRIVAAFTDNDDAVFSIKDAEGIDRIQASVSQAGEPMLSFMDAAGGKGVQIAYDLNTGPIITVAGEEEKGRITLHTVASTGYLGIAIVGPTVGGNGIIISFKSDGTPIITGLDRIGLKTFSID